MEIIYSKNPGMVIHSIRRPMGNPMSILTYTNDYLLSAVVYIGIRVLSPRPLGSPLRISAKKLWRLISSTVFITQTQGGNNAFHIHHTHLSVHIHDSISGIG
jgi:hypothetical protein